MNIGNLIIMVEVYDWVVYMGGLFGIVMIV